MKFKDNLLYPKGTKVYDSSGVLYATTTVDICYHDEVHVEQFDFISSKPIAGDLLDDPILQFVKGTPYLPKE